MIIVKYLIDANAQLSGCDLNVAKSSEDSSPAVIDKSSVWYCETQVNQTGKKGIVVST